MQNDFDLVDEMQWEDIIEFETLENAGLENNDYDTVPTAQKEYYIDEGEY